MYLQSVFTILICCIILISCNNEIRQEEEFFDPEPSKVILLVDLSTSMKGIPARHLKVFAHEVIDSTLKYDTEIELRGFKTRGNFATCKSPFSVVVPYTKDATLLHNKVQSMSVRGGTPLPEAIEQTIDYALASTEKDEYVLIYLFSDGLPTCGAMKDKMVKFLAHDRIIFYVVAYGYPELSPLGSHLEKLAKESGGEYVWFPAGSTVRPFSAHAQYQTLSHKNEPYRKRVSKNRNSDNRISNGDSRYENQNSRKSSSEAGK